MSKGFNSDLKLVFMRDQKTVSSIFRTGSGSSTLIIPKQIAKQSGLDEPCHVVIESTLNGVLIKKLDLG